MNDPAAAMEGWLASAEGGDVWTYHIGNLAFDRLTRGKLDLAAGLLLTLAQESKVFLTQVRVQPGVCAYLVTKARQG